MNETNGDRPARQRPLEGIRILDFTRMLAGAGTTRILGLLGAEVLRVEWPHPPALDFLRLQKPHVDGIPGMNRGGFFAQINPHKKSLAIDASTDAGKAILKELVPLCDVVTDSFRPGVLDRWGMGFEDLKKMRPDIIYVPASGFGQIGPFRDYGSVGNTAQAYSGLTGMSGIRGEEPAGWGFSYMDHMGAAMNAVAIMMALTRKRLTARPEYIDCGQSLEGIPLLGPALLDAAVNGAKPRPDGNRDVYRNLSPNNAYRCRPDAVRGVDAWVAISVATAAEWQALCSVMGLSELAGRAQLNDLSARVAAEDEIDAAISAWTIERERYEVMAALQAAGVPAGAVQHADDKVERDPQLAHRSFYQMITEPILGTKRYEGMPIKSDRYDTSITIPRPRMGEHTREVLRSLLGYTDERVDTLVAEGVLLEADATEMVEEVPA